MILRRSFLALSGAFALIPSRVWARTGVRGKLASASDGSPRLTLPGGQSVRLEGDADTMGVLMDGRLWGSDFEVFGERVNAGLFRLDAIHTVAMFVYREGKKLIITYWCDVCFIRTYTPSKCVCCQKETDLDLRDPDEK